MYAALARPAPALSDSREQQLVVVVVVVFITRSTEYYASLVKLELRHLWGAPQAWEFSGEDEQLLRRLVRDLNEHVTDVTRRTAVLVATEDNGEVVGAWNREGADRLARTIKHDPPHPPWVEVWRALEDGVAGP